MRILMFIGSLEAGGAERQFSQIADGLAARGHQVRMCTLFPGGAFWKELSANPSVDLTSLFSHRPAGKATVLSCLYRANARLKKFMVDQDVIYSALSLTDFIAWRATRSKRVPLVWGVRSGNLPVQWKLRVPFELCRLVSPAVTLIIANSKQGKAILKSAGYRTTKIVVIQNGIDTGSFQFNGSGRAMVRAEWKLEDSDKLIGIVGRITPEKGHKFFLDAAARVLDRCPSARFVSVGGGSGRYRNELMRRAETLGLERAMLWAGQRGDLPDVYSALDLCCSASVIEGFPNVLAEAMACGLRCVATDVGDSREILADDEWIIPPGDPQALAHKIISAVERKPARLPPALSASIAARFGIERMVDETERAISVVVSDQCRR